MRGTVKWFDRVKGYGFITSDDDGNDYFVHHSSICMEGYKTLSDCDIVDFEIGTGKDGRKMAVNVQPILTRRMVEKALRKDDLILKSFTNALGLYRYLVVNENNVIQSPEQGMTLLEAAKYAELDVSEID